MIASSTHDAIAAIYREQRGRVLATLIGLLGSFELAEEAVQEAFAVALKRWPDAGIPANPSAWLISTGRNRAIDRLRREARGERVHALAALEAPTCLDAESAMGRHDFAEAYPDDRLRLIFTCCHPALSLEAQVALTLQTLGGLTTPQIARAFLLPVATLAQRIVRAKAKIRDTRIPYRVPSGDEIPDRLEAVMLVLYLVFNQGNALHAESATLALEAIRLTRLLGELMPSEPEIEGLLALMLLNHARRDARVTATGDLILLDGQDRAKWDRAEIEEGLRRVEHALRLGVPGAYSVQAAIAALHASAVKAGETDWRQIAGLYRVLMRLDPSPIIELNYAVAVAMDEGPVAGLALLEELGMAGALEGYGHFHAARADLYRRLGDGAVAAGHYRRALEFADGEAERRFLVGRLAEVEAGAGQV